MRTDSRDLQLESYDLHYCGSSKLIHRSHDLQHRSHDLLEPILAGHTMIETECVMNRENPKKSFNYFMFDSQYIHHLFNSRQYHLHSFNHQPNEVVSTPECSHVCTNCSSCLDLYTQPQNSLKGGYRIVHDNPRTQEVTHMPRVSCLQPSVLMEQLLITCSQQDKTDNHFEHEAPDISDVCLCIPYLLGTC